MKKRVLAVLAVVLVLLTGCGKPAGNINEDIVGSWAYNHDAKTAIAVFKEDGSAVYYGKKYTFSTDESFIILSDKSGTETKLRYEITDEGMDLYRVQTYTRMDESTGLYGYWLDTVNNFTFEFTENNTFREDGNFTGYYTDNGKDAVNLMYEQYFDDITIYYTLNGNELVVEYPWQMVATTK